MRALFITLAFIATAYCLCKVGGKDRYENEIWVEGGFLMQCLKMGNWGGWRTIILACMINDKQIAVGTSATFGQINYICEEAENGVVRMRYIWI